MITYAIDALRHAGCTDIVINLHHRAEQLADRLQTLDAGVRLTLVFESDILGTGGGILNAATQLDGDTPVLVCNADTYTAQDLGLLVERHREAHCLATLMVNDRQTSRAVLLDEQFRFLGKESWFPEGQSWEMTVRRYGFCGVHVIDPSLFSLDYPRGFADIFDVYRHAMQRGSCLQGFETREYWSDLGTPERLRDFECHLADVSSEGKRPDGSEPVV